MIKNFLKSFLKYPYGIPQMITTAGGIYYGLKHGYYGGIGVGGMMAFIAAVGNAQTEQQKLMQTRMIYASVPIGIITGIIIFTTYALIGHRCIPWKIKIWRSKFMKKIRDDVLK